MEHGFDQLTTQLGRWDSRRRLRDGLIWLPRAVLTGLLLAAMVAAAARLQPLLTNREVATVTLALATAAFCIGIVVNKSIRVKLVDNFFAKVPVPFFQGVFSM